MFSSILFSASQAKYFNRKIDKHIIIIIIIIVIIIIAVSRLQFQQETLHFKTILREFSFYFD